MRIFALSTTAFLVIVSLSDLTAGYIYKGCYADGEARDLEEEKLEITVSSAADCVAACSEKKYKYAGLQLNDSCYCGNSYGEYGQVDDSQCNNMCTGNTSETCGGLWRNSIYEIEIVSEYKGCFVDNRVRDLGGSKTEFYDDNSAAKCAKYCWDNGYKYFGLQSRDCYCDNTYGRYGEVDKAQCSRTCFRPYYRRSRDICGGTWRNSIYSVKSQ